MAVLVLDKRKKPLMPCSEKRARLLLERGLARVHRIVPLTSRLVDRLQEDSTLQPARLKLDSGSQTTGIALVREHERVDASTGEVQRQVVVLMLLELQHRGHAIRDALTQRRAFRRRWRGNLRYRPARFDNRTKPTGWLAPSLHHRVDTMMAWVRRLWAPVTDLSQELVLFDTQAIQNPEVAEAAYHRGTHFGYELREYLLEKWGRQCTYCSAENVPLEIEHIHPRSKDGSNRVSNLAIACHECNQAKGNIPLEQFLAKDTERLRRIRAQAKVPLRDAAAVNSTRWALWQRLKVTGLAVEVASGGRTKWNRHQLRIPKEHCLDAACVGHIDSVESWQQPVLTIKATGRGSYQRTRLNKCQPPRPEGRSLSKAPGLTSLSPVEAGLRSVGHDTGGCFSSPPPCRLSLNASWGEREPWGGPNKPTELWRGETAIRRRHQPRKGTPKGEDSAGFRFGSASAPPDALHREAGSLAAAARSGGGAPDGSFHDPAEGSPGGRIQIPITARQIRPRQQNDGRGHRPGGR